MNNFAVVGLVRGYQGKIENMTYQKKQINL